MPEQLTLGVAGDGDALAAFDAILSDCFAPTGEEGDTAKWRERIPAADRRVGLRGGEVVATLAQVPMGQWFGGRSVPTMGVAGVGVAPHARGGGAATELMRLSLREWRAEGFPLSTLYASTYGLYQGVGYERAGGRFLATVRLSELTARETELRTVPLDGSNQDAVAALHRAWGCANPGNLDRGPYLWGRLERPRIGEREGCLLVNADGSPEGYVLYVRSKEHDVPYSVFVLDAVAATPRAARAFLAFLGGFRTIADRATWASAPNDPLLAHLPDRRYELKLSDQWMLRLLDVPAALTRRGYPRGLEAELHLAVRDDVLPENDGRFVLKVADGVGAVSAGGEGRLSVDVRGLAALYTGHLSPDQLAAAGLLEGPEEDRAAAGPVFAGPAPWMTDPF